MRALHTATLPNGLRVVVVERSDLHSAAAVLHVGVGARYERPEQSGLSHFLEHLLFQGCDGFDDSAALTRRVENLGGSLDAWTSAEFTTFALSVHRRHWDEGLAILAAVIQTPRFMPERVEAEKRVLRQELARQTDPEHGNIALDDLVYNQLWRVDQPEAAIGGAIDAIESLTPERCRAWHVAGYRPDNMVLCLSGGIDAAAALERAAALFTSPAPEGPLLRRFPLESQQSSPRLLTKYPAWPTVNLRLAHRAWSWSDPRSSALQVLNEMLGGATSSRLFLRVREELGLVYDIGSDLALFSDGGSIEVSCAVEPEQLGATVTAIMTEWRRACAGDWLAGEVAETIERLRCRLDFLSDSAYETAEWYAKQSLLLGPDHVRSPEQAVADIGAVTEAQVTEAARACWVPAGRVCVALGRIEPEHEAALRAALAAELDADTDARTGADAGSTP